MGLWYINKNYKKVNKTFTSNLRLGEREILRCCSCHISSTAIFSFALFGRESSSLCRENCYFNS